MTLGHFVLLTFAIGIVLLIGLALRKVGWNTETGTFEPVSNVRVPSELEDRLHLSIYDSHRTNLDPNGRVRKVGVDHHSPFCASPDGLEFECQCAKGTA